jgi:ribosomal protein S18 acetylase RimI-like enzyme
LEKIKMKDLLSLSSLSIACFKDTFRGTCTEEDLELFCDFTYSYDILLQESEDKNTEIWVLKEDMNLIGYLKINLNLPLPFPKESISGLEIQRLYIDKPYHKMGLGKKLMNLAESRAVNNKQSIIWLGVWEFNENAKLFYEYNGFSYFGSHPFPIGNTPQTDLWMLKNLYSNGN